MIPMPLKATLVQHSLPTSSGFTGMRCVCVCVCVCVCACRCVCVGVGVCIIFDSSIVLLPCRKGRIVRRRLSMFPVRR